MLLVREVVHCKPGKVGEMVKRFKVLSAVMVKMNFKPMRLLTDVSGEPYWTVVAEMEVDDLGDFMKIESKVMADKEAQAAMAGYHDLVDHGRREIFKIEA